MRLGHPVASGGIRGELLGLASWLQPPENIEARENDGGQHLDFRFKSDVFYAGQFFVKNGDFFSL
jgi:hypothetical protein